MSENRLVEAIIGRARVQEARGGKLVSWWGSVLLQYLTSGRGNQYRSPLSRPVAPSNSTNLNQSQPKYGRHTARDHFVFLMPLDSIDDISHAIVNVIICSFLNSIHFRKESSSSLNFQNKKPNFSKYILF